MVLSEHLKATIAHVGIVPGTTVNLALAHRHVATAQSYVRFSPVAEFDAWARMTSAVASRVAVAAAPMLRRVATSWLTLGGLDEMGVETSVIVDTQCAASTSSDSVRAMRPHRDPGLRVLRPATPV